MALELFKRIVIGRLTTGTGHTPYCYQMIEANEGRFGSALAVIRQVVSA